MIEIGDLVWDDVRKIFGMVTEEVDHEACTWIVSWYDGRQNWVDAATINYWKYLLEELRKEIVK